MRRVLATEDRIGLGHDLFDERVTDLGAHGNPTVLADHFGYRLRADQVVQHGGTRMGAQHGSRQQRGCGRATEAAAGLVDDEHAVGITVEGETYIEAARHNPRLQVALVGWLQRVGGVVGEGAVELAVHDFQGELRQTLEHGRHDEPAHAVGGVGDDA